MAAASGSLASKYLPRIGYMSTEMGTTFSFYMISSFLSVFYTDAVGLTPMVVSTLMLVVRVIDAVVAPVLGGIIDGTRSKWGRCRPWLLWGLPFLVLLSILTFSDFNFSGAGKVMYAYITYIGLELAFMLVDTSKAALVNTITADGQERVVLNSWRSAGGSIINIVLSAITMPIILFLGNDSGAYQITNVIYIIVCIPLILAGFFLCKETVVDATTRGEKVKFSESMASLVKNPMLLLLVVSSVLGTAASLSRIGTQVYYYQHSLQRADLAGTIMVAYQVGQFLVPFVVPTVLRFLGKKMGMIVANALDGVALLVLFLMGPNANPIAVIVCTFFVGFFAMSALMSFSATSDCIEYGYFRNGKRTPGASVGVMTMSVKLGLAIGGSLGLFLLGLFGYHQGVVVDEAMRENINFVVNAVPAILTFLCVLPLIPYKLTNKRMKEINAKNAEADAILASRNVGVD
ncbi:MFS transporter [Bifidobacterium pullorum]|uniref:MFS transporter n=1 Tax=Bifidobacterium pullorum TaxID=78448 RepID=UPI003AB333AC